MFLILVSIILVCFWVGIAYKRTYEKWAPLQKVPGPKPVPLLGNVFDVDPSPKGSLEDITKLTEKYGDVVKLTVGPLSHVLILSNPYYLEQLLTSTVHLHKGVLYDFLYDWIGRGMIVANGSIWRNSRKVINPIFNSKVMDGFCIKFDHRNREFVKELQTIGSSSFDIVPLITRNGFLHMFDTLLGENIDEAIMTKYMEATKITSSVGVSRFFSLKRFDFIFRWTNDCKRLKQAIKNDHDCILHIMKLRRAERKEIGKDNIINKTFLDLLLDIQEEDPNYQDIDIIQQIDTFMFAGHDTVSSGVDFATYELSKDRELQEKIFEESNKIFGPDRMAQLTMRKMEECKYIDRFVKEVLRKHPPAPMIERTTIDPLKFGDIDIPIGTSILLAPFVTHHTEKYFPNPQKFDPDRFLPENMAKRPAYAYLPFSHGPRNCIGQRFAIMEMKSTVLMMVRHFILSKGYPDFDVEIAQTGTLKSLTGVHVKLERRV